MDKEQAERVAGMIREEGFSLNLSELEVVVIENSRKEWVVYVYGNGRDMLCENDRAWMHAERWRAEQESTEGMIE